MNRLYLFVEASDFLVSHVRRFFNRQIVNLGFWKPFNQKMGSRHEKLVADFNVAGRKQFAEVSHHLFVFQAGGNESAAVAHHGFKPDFLSEFLKLVKRFNNVHIRAQPDKLSSFKILDIEIGGQNLNNFPFNHYPHHVVAITHDRQKSSERIWRGLKRFKLLFRFAKRLFFGANVFGRLGQNFVLFLFVFFAKSFHVLLVKFQLLLKIFNLFF